LQSSQCLRLIDSIDPVAYAKTRNHLQGAVTGLSPWITHGAITLRELAAMLASRHQLSVQHPLIYELGWRAYFRHVFSHYPESIHDSFRQGPLPDRAYQQHLPQTLVEGRSGVPAIDAAVACLYETGSLHNHARLWLASYCIHFCRVRWQAGANWMIEHLLDGDIASNSLSWQWVAGTFSHKPYLFNADNVARFAPESWRSPGTSIDTDYASLEAISRGASLRRDHPAPTGLKEPIRLEPSELPEPLMAQFGLLRAAHYRGRIDSEQPGLWLVHPWALRKPQSTPDPGNWHPLGFIPDDLRFMRWTLKRWQWVLDAMRSVCQDIVIGSIRDLHAIRETSPSIHTWSNIHVNDYWPSFVEQHDELPLFPEADRFHASFSSWWKAVSRRHDRLDDLLAYSGQHA